MTDSPFDVIDTSLKEAAPRKTWEDKARAAIKRLDIVVVMVGPKTHKASGVLKEVRIAQDYYRSARGRTIGSFGINKIGCDLYRLTSIELDDGLYFDTWIDAIDKAVTDNALLVVYGHANSTDPALLAAFVDSVQQKAYI